MSDDAPYSLGASAKGLGQLTPILTDAHGHVIDGFHRQNADPDWPRITVDAVDTPQQLELARLAVNFCRRTMSASEMQNRLVFLVGKCGMKPDEIAELTGISRTTIYKYLPQALKDAKKVDAGIASGVRRAVPPAEQTVKTSDTPPKQVECGLCHKQVYYPKYPEVNGNIIRSCAVCADKLRTGELTLPEKPPKRTSTLTAPKPTETWDHRKATMQPPVSRMEVRVAAALTAKGVAFESQKPFCLQRVTADFYLPQRNLAVYLDGAPHAGREDRDAALRERLATRHGVTVLSVPYTNNSQKAEDAVLRRIMEALE